METLDNNPQQIISDIIAKHNIVNYNDDVKNRVFMSRVNRCTSELTDIVHYRKDFYIKTQLIDDLILKYHINTYGEQIINQIKNCLSELETELIKLKYV